MPTCPRTLTLFAFALWFGGFTFYAGVVVPVGTEIQGSAFDQGLITARVTVWLNALGFLAAVTMTWDAWRRERRCLAAATVALACAALLFVLHARLAGQIDHDAGEVLDHRIFYARHRWYLIVCTIQWLAGIVWFVLTLHASRTRSPNDRREIADHESVEACSGERGPGTAG